MSNFFKMWGLLVFSYDMCIDIICTLYTYTNHIYMLANPCALNSPGPRPTCLSPGGPAQERRSLTVPLQKLEFVRSCIANVLCSVFGHQIFSRSRQDNV